MSAEKQQGKVKFFTEEKGYGFLIPDNSDGSSDVFFHATHVKGKHPQEGDIVEYSMGNGKKGPCAIDVVIIS